MRSWTIKIPRLPSREMSPNFHGHWSRTARAKIMDQNEVIGCFSETYTRPDVPVTKARVTVDVYRRTKQRLDADNFAARCKGYWDGLVKAGLLADDNVSVIGTPEYTFHVDKERAGTQGMVIFHVEELE
jgi:hypothetical protein